MSWIGRRRSGMPGLQLTLDRRFLSSLSQDRDVSGNSRFLGSLAPTSGLWAAEPKLARFVRQTAVDDTEERNASALWSLGGARTNYGKRPLF
jgi:hypothetical protein